MLSNQFWTGFMEERKSSCIQQQERHTTIRAQVMEPTTEPVLAKHETRGNPQTETTGKNEVNSEQYVWSPFLCASSWGRGASKTQALVRELKHRRVKSEAWRELITVEWREFISSADASKNNPNIKRCDNRTRRHRQEVQQPRTYQSVAGTNSSGTEEYNASLTRCLNSQNVVSTPV